MELWPTAKYSAKISDHRIKLCDSGSEFGAAAECQARSAAARPHLASATAQHLPRSGDVQYTQQAGVALYRKLVVRLYVILISA